MIQAALEAATARAHRPHWIRVVGISVIALALQLSACSRLTHIPRSVSVTGIDFTEYTRQGFMFTPEMYQGSYESVGIIYVTVHAEGRLVRGTTGFEEWQFEEIQVQDVIRDAFERASEMGANAIVNFSVRSVPRALTLDIQVPGIEVSGLAIKRLPSSGGLED